MSYKTSQQREIFPRIRNRPRRRLRRLEFVMLRPMNWLRARVGEPVLAVRHVFRNPDLRCVELAWAGSITGQYAFSVALAVYAYRHGGASVVGLVIVARMVPAAIVAPFAAIVADRGRRKRVMLTCDLVRGAGMLAAAATVFAGGPAVAVYALAALVTTVGTVFHPAQAALLPALASSPEELSATNVTSSSIESIGSFVGPAAGGMILAVASTATAFLVASAAFLWSALIVARIRPAREVPHAGATSVREAAGIRREALEGFRTISLDQKLRVIVGLYVAQTIVAGAVSVLIVVTALGPLDFGNGGVGYLNSAIGVGGLVGAAIALALVGRGKLAGDFGAGVVLWGTPLVVIGIWPAPAVALVMLAVLGLGNTLVDVSALTLLQRGVPDDVLARVFGVVEGLTVAAMGLGAVVAPLLVAEFGIRVALITTGLFLPGLAAVLWSRLNAIDGAARVPIAELTLMRSIPIFAPLPAATLEHLANALRRVQVPAGTDVVRAGDVGHNFFIIETGTAEVLVDKQIRPIGPGDYFGEVALLRDVPRTATVRAVTKLTVYALERNEFIGAVTGHPPSRNVADAVIGDRLGSLRAGITPV
jgi:MFS family permease